MIDAIIYPGTFDPITNGHLDLIIRAARMCKRIVVAVAANYEKHPLFELDERVRLIQDSLQIVAGNYGNDAIIEVRCFDNLLVEFANSIGITTILRGLRAVSDFEYELQQASVNRVLDCKIETIFLMTSERYSYLSSSAVRSIARYHGCVEALVPPPVQQALMDKLGFE